MIKSHLGCSGVFENACYKFSPFYQHTLPAWNIVHGTGIDEDIILSINWDIKGCKSEA
jgi:hypothetical protein